MAEIEGLHADDHAIIKFAHKMREKMRFAREERGRGGWTGMSAEELSAMLRGHVEKGDPVDVANFCMMLSANGADIAPASGVTGLVRYKLSHEGRGDDFHGCMKEHSEGKYLSHDQAAAVIAAKDGRITDYKNLVDALHTKLAQIEKQEPIRAVKLADCVEHHNPQYGGGYFLTDDAICDLYAAPVASDTDLIADAKRYRYLRSRDLDTIQNGGVFAGQTPESYVLNGEDLDAAIDAALNPSEPRT